MKKLVKLIIKIFPREFVHRNARYVLRIWGLFLRGNKVECPICEISYRKFLPYGSRRVGANRLCPDSMSLERHRLLWLYFKEKTNLFEANLRVLHVAPEECFIGKFKKMSNLDYVTSDIEHHLADIKMDVQDIPLESDSLDVIICNHVLEHVIDDRLAMRELYRVLKPGGWAILQVPQNFNSDTTFEDPAINTAELRKEHYYHYDHKRLYGLDYGDRLREQSFTVNEDRFVENLPSDKVERYRLDSREIIYFCSKQQ